MDINDYHIILPGRIIEYFAADQTATILISAESTYDDSDNISELEENTTIKDVPVHTPFGGGWSLTFPIKPDDTCLLVFSQCGYDHWLFDDKDKAGSFKGRGAYWLDRKFDVDDGFAMVGFNTLPRAIQSYSPIHSQWRNDIANQIITLNEDGTIDATSPIQITINAPSVIVNAMHTVVNSTVDTIVNTPAAVLNSATAVVNATASTTVNTPVAAINATTSATVTTPVAAINATTSATITTPVAAINASTSASVTAPVATIVAANTTITAATACNITSPITTITGNLSVTGTISNP